MDAPNSVLGKTFQILSAFDDHAETLRLIELSERSGVPKPSVYRLAQELVGLGLLERAGAGYRLGVALFALGQRVTSVSQLRSAARPVLVDLCASTQATLHLAVIEGDKTYYLEKLGGTRSVQRLSSIGGRLPLNCTASGKLLLALASRPETLLSRLDETGLVRLTPRSVATVPALRRELEAIRLRRLATEHEEALLGYKSVAVPVQGPGDRVLAALSATVPIRREIDQYFANQLRSAATVIARRHSQLCMAADPGPDHRAARVS